MELEKGIKLFENRINRGLQMLNYEALFFKLDNIPNLNLVLRLTNTTLKTASKPVQSKAR